MALVRLGGRACTRRACSACSAKVGEPGAAPSRDLVMAPSCRVARRPAMRTGVGASSNLGSEQRQLDAAAVARRMQRFRMGRALDLHRARAVLQRCARQGPAPAQGQSARSRTYVERQPAAAAQQSAAPRASAGEEAKSQNAGRLLLQARAERRDDTHHATRAGLEMERLAPASERLSRLGGWRAASALHSRPAVSHQPPP